MAAQVHIQAENGAGLTGKAAKGWGKFHEKLRASYARHSRRPGPVVAKKPG